MIGKRQTGRIITKSNKNTPSKVQCEYIIAEDSEEDSVSAKRCKFDNTIPEDVSKSFSRKLRIKIDDKVRRRLERVKDWNNWGVDATVTQAISSGKLLQCCLKKESGRDAYTLFASTTIEEDKCLGVLTGELWAEKEFNSKIGDDRATQHLLTYDIRCELIGKSYRGPRLILYYGNASNELQHIQESSWVNCLDGDDEANVHFQVAWCHKSYLPYVVCVAKRRIEKGEELFVQWGRQVWSYVEIKNMNSQAHSSHRIHVYCMILERAIATAGVSVPYKAQNKRGRDTDASQRRSISVVHDADDIKYQDMESLGEGSYARLGDPNIYMPVEEGLKRLVSRDEAFRYSKCEYGIEMRCELEPATRTALSEWANTYGHTLVHIQADPELERLFAHGGTPKCEVKEVVSLYHPARWFSTPNTTSYALAANALIEKDEYVGFYTGTITEDRKKSGSEYMHQWYAYEVSPGKEYKGKKLIIESLKSGNECRYINDCFCRKGGMLTVNTEAVIVWDRIKSLPLIALKAKRTITAGEEIVSSYGDSFWGKVSKIIMIQHASYAVYMNQRISHLKEQCTEKGIPIPPVPTDARMALIKKFEKDVDYSDYD